MAEAGGPTIAEVQVKPAGVVDRVKAKLREMFTPLGRAEVMAKKQMDTILAQVPQEKRAEAMKMLEERRPDLVAAAMPGAKDRLVKEAVIGAGVLGTVIVGGTVAVLNRGKIIDAAFGMGVPFEKGANAALGARDRMIKIKKQSFVNSIRSAASPVTGFVNGFKDFIDGFREGQKMQKEIKIRQTTAPPPPKQSDSESWKTIVSDAEAESQARVDDAMKLARELDDATKKNEQDKRMSP